MLAFDHVDLAARNIGNAAMIGRHAAEYQSRRKHQYSHCQTYQHTKKGA